MSAPCAVGELDGLHFKIFHAESCHHVRRASTPVEGWATLLEMTPADPRLEAVTARLAAAGCVAPAREAVLLLDGVTDGSALEARVARREQGEPLAWITGSIRFCGRRLYIDPGVYVPRAQTEDLARRAAGFLVDHGRALDLCTGAGAVASHVRAAVPTAAVLGVDLDPAAAACARRNGVPTIVGDLAEAVQPEIRFDLVTAVAPYVPTEHLRLLPADVVRYEPRLALAGGGDGLDVVRRIVGVAAARLGPGGWLVLEVGGDQHRALAPTLAAHGFGVVDPWFDTDGDLRGLAAQATTR
jgi:release factor glutamine methyltransferase